MKNVIAGVLVSLLPMTALADPMGWANDKQRDLVSSLAAAFASTEICNVDIDPQRVGDVIGKSFGDRLTAQKTADLLYMIGVVRAVQGAQMRSANSSQIQDRCENYKRRYGPDGTDIKGVLR